MSRCKWKATKWYDSDGFEHYCIERTHPDYGWPAVQTYGPCPKFHNYQEAVDFAKKLNGETEQMTLF